jgi:hypothetical protein
MSTGIEAPARPARREDFPVDTFQYLEWKLQLFRKLAMSKAAKIAADTNPDANIYRVERTHVDQALGELVDPEFVDTELGSHPLSNAPRK